MHAFSFFKVPSCIILSIESLLKKNLWGVVRIIGKSLGLIGTLFVWTREFNISLLWFKGLSFRYGVEGGRVKKGREGKGNGFVWWKELVHIRDGVSLEVGVGLKRVYGGRLVMKKIFFCTYRWLGDMALRDRFQRLFKLSENKWSSVEDMFSLG